MDDKILDYMRALIIKSVGRANSGHPGGALSGLDFTYLLYSEYLRFDPDCDKWLARDRFVLSAGHMSILQYVMLRAVGWLSDKDLMNFRKLHSMTPGHPEVNHTRGVECTTGPLGQGAAMAVGFAIASYHLQSHLDENLFKNRVWALLGDGCMQEDVTLGAASLAGHLKLDNLIWYYDKNNQQISGSIDRASSDNIKEIFTGFGWQVIEVDGHDHMKLRACLDIAVSKRNKPLLIVGASIIAKGAATLEGSYKSHGAPFSEQEQAQTLLKLGIKNDDTIFEFPLEFQKYFQKRFVGLRGRVKSWKKSCLDKQNNDASFFDKYCMYFSNKDYIKFITKLAWDRESKLATRESFGKILEHWGGHCSNLIGGSADLEPSNMTGAFAKLVGDFTASNRRGRNIAFGVREFPMSAVSNGIALYGGIKVFDATFLVFSDYSRPAIRLGAIQKAAVIHEFTHDSFYLGEDGPTHQPIEHLMSLRLIPDLYVLRPCDSNETEVLVRHIIELDVPSCFCLSRQKLPFLTSGTEQEECLIKKGAWLIKDTAKECDMIFFATGSEVGLAIAVAEELEKSYLLSIRVVSLPCWELFFAQSEEYKNNILSYYCKKRVSFEAGSSLGWEKFVGNLGLKVSIDHYGCSAPYKDLEEEFGFTQKQVVKRIKNFFHIN
jgi:transketolase